MERKECIPFFAFRYQKTIPPPPTQVRLYSGRFRQFSPSSDDE